MRIEEAIFNDAAPSNPRPFVRRMDEMLENGVSIKSEEFRACLWAVNSMVFGQLVRIDMHEEWKLLYYHFKEKNKK